MNLHTFIRERDLPRNRVARIAKEEATSRLRASIEDEDLETPELEERWPEIGLRVRTPSESSRYQYEVTDPEAFRDFLLGKMDLGTLLSEEEIFQLATTAAYFRQILEDRTGWALVDPDSGEKADPSGASMPAALGEQVGPVLARIGMDV